ncbi:MAG: DUF4349 domain-containing protein [Bacteroidales bacterium]|nr:DUF4349 domain-containing protein [Bacteroidales bacterium]
MKSAKFLLLIFTLSFLFSCQDSKYSDETSEMYTESYAPGEISTGYNTPENQKDAMYYGEEEYSYDDYDDVGDVTEGGNTSSIQPITADEIKKIGKKIIKNADVSLEVEDYNKDMTKLRNTFKEYDCYITNENESNYENYISNIIVIRVKSSQFDSLMNSILNGNGKVTSKSIYVDDVTEQYVDVYQRLKNKKSIEQQYLELLKKAYTVNDVLNVTQYLRMIQEEIESSEGRLRYMDDQSDYSTITLRITYSGETIAYKETFWDKAVEGMETGWQGVVTFIVALFYLWPIWILLGIIIFVVRRSVKKYNSNKTKNI